MPYQKNMNLVMKYPYTLGIIKIIMLIISNENILLVELGKQSLHIGLPIPGLIKCASLSALCFSLGFCCRITHKYSFGRSSLLTHGLALRQPVFFFFFFFEVYLASSFQELPSLQHKVIESSRIFSGICQIEEVSLLQMPIRVSMGPSFQPLVQYQIVHLPQSKLEQALKVSLCPVPQFLAPLGGIKILKLQQYWNISVLQCCPRLGENQVFAKLHNLFRNTLYFLQALNSFPPLVRDLYLPS